MKLSAAFLIATAALPFSEACPFSNLGGENPHQVEDRVLQQTDPVASLPKRIADRTLQARFQGSPADAIATAKIDILDIMAEDPRLGPKFVRLGFHDCVGGLCDGCVDMNNSDNAGLGLPMDALVGVSMFYENQLTRADIWALAAMTAAEAMQQGGRFSYDFEYYGRETCPDMEGGPVVAMPSTHLTTENLLDFFDDNFGFGTSQAVAMMGAHTLGRLSNRNSGFSGQWVRRITSLDNAFYRLLVANGETTDRYNQSNQQNSNQEFSWTLQPPNTGAADPPADGQQPAGTTNGGAPPAQNGGVPTQNGTPPQNGGQPQQTGGRSGGQGGRGGRPNLRRQLQRGGGRGQGGRGNGGNPNGAAPANGSRLIMLNADMSLVSDFDQYMDSTTGEVFCAMQSTNNPDNLTVCPEAETFATVVAYSQDNMLWLEDFRDTLTAMTLVGYDVSAGCSSPPCSLV